MKALLITVVAIGIGAAALALGESDPPTTKKSHSVKYRQGKEIDFEALLIQGELQRPEISVVTGNAEQGSDGLLRLRENFLDRIAADFGEAEEPTE